MNNSINEQNNDQSKIRKWIKNLYKRLFWDIPAEKIYVPHNFDDIIEIIKEHSPSEEEKKFICAYYSGRSYLTKKWKYVWEGSSYDILALISKYSATNIPVGKLLWHLWPRIIHERYWEVILLYVWHNIIYTLGGNDENEIYEEYLKTKTNIVWENWKYLLLKKAKIAMWQLHWKRELIYTIALYDLFLKSEEYFRWLNLKKYIDDEDFSVELDYSKDTSAKWISWKYWQKHYDINWEDISEIDEEHYFMKYKNFDTFKNVWERTNWEWKSLKLFLDSPIWLLLKYQWKVIAVIWFSLSDESTICIHQFQQIPYDIFDRYGRMIWKRVEDIAKTLDWQNILYQMIYDFWKNNWYKKLQIKSWENNFWTKEKRKELWVDSYWKVIELETDVSHLSKEIALRIYDIFAKEHWFNANKAKDWVKRIS